MPKSAGQGERGQTDYQLEVIDLGVARAAGAEPIVQAGRAVRQVFCQQLTTAAALSIALGAGKAAHPLRVLGAGWSISWPDAPHRDGIWAVNALQAGATAELLIIYDEGAGMPAEVRFE